MYFLANMSSVRSWPSFGREKESAKTTKSSGQILKTGNLRKLKRMKRKFFVLRGDSPEASARLEYYDSEKKFEANQPPKRSITLKTCFNINKRTDASAKWVIALYTKNECFCIVMDSEEEMEDWLKILLTLQRGENVDEATLPKPSFEHVWQITVQRKELGLKRNITGPHLLCLTESAVSLIKLNKEKTYEFPFHMIRCCGSLGDLFYIEIGKKSPLGSGSIWMKTEDRLIAQNMHLSVLSAFRNCPTTREKCYTATAESLHSTISNYNLDSSIRRANQNALSGTEGSLTVLGGRSHQRTHSFPLSPNAPSRRASTGTRPTPRPSAQTHDILRERCDSLPSQSRNCEDKCKDHHHHHSHRLQCMARPQSMHNRLVSCSPPSASSTAALLDNAAGPISPESAEYSYMESVGSSLSIETESSIVESVDNGSSENSTEKFGHSLTPDEPVILEENLDECDNILWQPDEDYITSDKLNLSVNHNYHNTMPNHSCNNVSSPSQGTLGDPCSHFGSSPSGSSSIYLKMSPPGDIKSSVFNTSYRGLQTSSTWSIGNSSGNHSRGSSITEEGSMPMTQSSHNDGYIDMESLISNHFHSGELTASSNCSLNSGTASIDTRYTTCCALTPSEDEVTPNERPARAYSVGSKPAFVKRNDYVNQSDSSNQRVRAFSVGSHYPRIRPSSSAHLNPPPRYIHGHSTSKKSDDLMMLDFSNTSSKGKNKHYRRSLAVASNSLERLSVPLPMMDGSSGYSDMSSHGSPKSSDMETLENNHYCPSPPKSYTRTANFITVGRSPPKSYMDMKPLSVSSSPPVNCGFLSAPLSKVPETDLNYVEMSSSDNSTPPVDQSNSTAHNSYLEMTPSKPVIINCITPKSDFSGSSSSIEQKIKIQTLQGSAVPPIKPNLLTTSNVAKPKGNRDDYVCMDMKKNLHLTEENDVKSAGMRTDTDGSLKKTPTGYVEMNFGTCKLDSANRCNNSGRCSSQPIAIQTKAPKDRSYFSTSPSSSSAERKDYSGTSPKIPLSLPLSASPISSPYSSLGRRKQNSSLKQESQDHLSSCSSTPIFPLSLNSPISPLKSPDLSDNRSRCDEPLSKFSAKNNGGASSLSLEGYNNSSKSFSSNTDDYIGFNPQKTNVKEDDGYTLMRPVNPKGITRKMSAPIINSFLSSQKRSTCSACESVTVPNTIVNSGINNLNLDDEVKPLNTIQNCINRNSSLEPSKSTNNNNNNIKTMNNFYSGNSNGSNYNDLSGSIINRDNRPSEDIYISATLNNNNLFTVHVTDSNTAEAANVINNSLSQESSTPVTIKSVPMCSCSSGDSSSTSNHRVNEIHYASLDLARSTPAVTSEEGSSRRGSVRNDSHNNQGASCSNTNASLNQINETPTYAEIDFSKININSDNS